jgi:hypothetical protein
MDPGRYQQLTGSGGAAPCQESTVFKIKFVRTQRAIDALHVSPVTVARIEAIMQETNEERDQELDRCDQLFYKTPQGTSKGLYVFIKANRGRVRL